MKIIVLITVYINCEKFNDSVYRKCEKILRLKAYMYVPIHNRIGKKLEGFKTIIFMVEA